MDIRLEDIDFIKEVVTKLDESGYRVSIIGGEHSAGYNVDIPFIDIRVSPKKLWEEFYKKRESRKEKNA